MLTLKKILTIALLFTSTFIMQTSFADENTIPESNMIQAESTLIDWNQKTQSALTARLDEKLQTQLTARNYSIEGSQVADLEEQVYTKTHLVLAAN